MKNKGAYITLTGRDMQPNFTTYEAVVSYYFLSLFFNKLKYCVIYSSFPEIKMCTFLALICRILLEILFCFQLLNFVHTFIL